MLQRTWVFIATAVLAAIGLASVFIVLLTAQDVPRVLFPQIVGGSLALFAALVATAGVALATNVRRPHGVHPDDALLAVSSADRAVVDAFALTTDDLTKHERRRVRPEQIPAEELPAQRAHRRGILGEDNQMYGRRATDVPIGQIRTVIDAVQQIKGAGTAPETVIDVPPWARGLTTDMQSDDAGDARAEQGKESP